MNYSTSLFIDYNHIIDISLKNKRCLLKTKLTFAYCRESQRDPVSIRFQEKQENKIKINLFQIQNFKISKFHFSYESLDELNFSLDANTSNGLVSL